MNVLKSTHVAHRCSWKSDGQQFLQFWANFQKSKKNQNPKCKEKKLLLFSKIICPYMRLEKDILRQQYVAHFFLSLIFQKLQNCSKIWRTLLDSIWYENCFYSGQTIYIDHTFCFWHNKIQYSLFYEQKNNFNS